MDHSLFVILDHEAADFVQNQHSCVHEAKLCQQVLA